MSKIQKFLEAAASDWESELSKDEWYFSRNWFRIQLVRLAQEMRSDSISDTVDLLIRSNEEMITYYGGSLLMALARRSGTTELPPNLHQNWDTICMKLGNFPDIAQPTAALVSN